MAFTVEDGTGLSDSNAYITTAFSDTYFGDRGNETWVDLDAEIKQYAIIKATDYLDWRWCYKGTIASSTQALQWPRDYVYDSLGSLITGVPTQIEKACAEYAFRIISDSGTATEDLSPDPVYDETGGKVIEFKNKVDVIEEMKKFSDSVNITTIRSYPQADNLLKDLVKSQNELSRV